MDSVHAPEASLDELCARSLAGDHAAETALFTSLRVRFATIAKRRVHRDHLEDVVQDTLHIVLGKYRQRPLTTGILVWSLTVLRNVIGNYYQARRREMDRVVQVEDLQSLAGAATWDPADCLEASEVTAHLEAAIATLASKFPRCGKIFAGILASLELGGGPREISQRALEMIRREQPDLTPNHFYVALHRCRAQLRALLGAQEGSVSHD